MIEPPCSNFRVITPNFSGVQNFRIFTVMCFYHEYRKKPKNLNTRKICCIYPKSWTVWFCDRVMCPKNADGMEKKQYRPWSDCSSRSSLIWVYTVCLDLPVRKLRIVMVMQPKMQMEWNKCRHRSDCSGAVWSGSALFAQACLSKNLRRTIMVGDFRCIIFS